MIIWYGGKKQIIQWYYICVYVPYTTRSIRSIQHFWPGMGAAARSTSFAGPITREAGFLGYNEICKVFSSSTSWWFLFIINIMISIDVPFIITFIIILFIIMLSVTRFLQKDEQWSNTDGVIPWWITWQLSLNRWLPRHWPHWTSGNWALCRHCPFWRDHLGMYSAKLIRCPFLMLESKY